MNAWTPAPSVPDDAPLGADAQEAARDRQLWMLERLAQAGMTLALAIERQAADVEAPADPDAGAPPPPSRAAVADALSDLSLAFSRVSRAVRLTLALHTRLKDERREALRAARGRVIAEAIRHAPQRRARVERIIERIAEAEHGGDAEAVERLVEEAAERLADVDVYGDVLSQPVSTLIDAICRDLGLAPDWQALAAEAWAREEMASEAVGAPLMRAGRQAEDPNCPHLGEAAPAVPTRDSASGAPAPGSRAPAPLRPG